MINHEGEDLRGEEGQNRGASIVRLVATKRQGVAVILSSPSSTPSYHRAASKQKNVDRLQSHISCSLGMPPLALHKGLIHRLRAQ